MNALTRDIQSCLSQLDVGGEGDLSARFVFPDGFRGFQGHFPGNPVLPGVCLVQAALAMLQAGTGRRVRLTSIVSAKWYAPVKPGEALGFAGRVRLDGERAATFRTTVTRGAARVAELVLKVDRLPDAEAPRA